MQLSNRSGDGSKCRKRPPAYLETLHHYPTGNPLFIAVDWDSLQWIHRLRGLCLLCNRVLAIMTCPVVLAGRSGCYTAAVKIHWQLCT